mmetsp:Transcript_16609/g.34062  ORF Transcript_16609/g.34062 Transcript_16609/m.34062 type:complete len:425 (+) Transcript_16609:157-1431(+)
MAGDSCSVCSSVRSTLSTPQEVSGISKSRSFNSTCSGSVASLPPSALRRGKYDPLGTGDASLFVPTSRQFDLSLVHAIYGQGACLYRVLQVEPTATDAEIRRAYLRQGRKTLLEQGLAQKNDQGQYTFVENHAPRKLDDVPHSARERFQAISIAYEILSQPEMKMEYDSYRSSFQSAEIARTRSANSVRWRPYVEEKIFHDSDRNERNFHKPQIHKKDGGWLESHLRNLDEEAEKFFTGEMFDELDESFASMQDSIGSLIKKAESIGQEIKTPVTSGLVESNKGRHILKNIVDDAAPEVVCVRVRQGAQQIIDKPKKSSLRVKAWQKLRGKSTSCRSPRSSVTNKPGSELSIAESPEETISYKNTETGEESFLDSFLDSPCSVFEFGLIGKRIDGTAASLADSFFDLLEGKDSTKQQSKLLERI